MKFKPISSILIILSVIFCSFAPLHKFYMSVFEFTYKPDEKTVQVTGRIFTDDFEEALEKASSLKLNLGEANESPDADKYVGEYLKKNIQLTVNGKEIELEYLGKEIEDEIAWVYLEAKGVNDYSKVAVENRIISEIREKQTNITYIMTGTKSESLLLKKGEWRGEVEM